MNAVEHLIRTSSAVFILIAALCLAMGLHAQPADASAHQYRLSGPYTKDNLTIYLVHGADQLKGKQFLTLQEAIEKNVVAVYETGSVNELAIENKSPNREVFVQSGDIVRGGRQDRVLSYDLILPPKSGRVPIASFCVEHGRWSKRGQESSTEFKSSNNQLSGRSLRLAAKYSREQGEVWNKVAETQKKLSENVGQRVNSDESESSMELALSNEKVQERAAAYVKHLLGVIDGKSDVVGFVFAINGEVNTADVYASASLFKKLWPKLLNAAVIEAIAEQRADAPTNVPSADTVQAVLRSVASGKAESRDVNKRVRVVTQETKDNVMFETRDREAADQWVHRNYIKLE